MTEATAPMVTRAMAHARARRLARAIEAGYRMCRELAPDFWIEGLGHDEFAAPLDPNMMTVYARWTRGGSEYGMSIVAHPSADALVDLIADCLREMRAYRVAS